MHSCVFSSKSALHTKLTMVCVFERDVSGNDRGSRSEVSIGLAHGLFAIITDNQGNKVAPEQNINVSEPYRLC